MGDRFTFGVTDTGGDVLYLYSHWGGDGWEETLKLATLRACLSGNTSQRANRVFISNIIGDNWQSDTGYALSINRPTDTEYGFIPIVDFDNKNVSFYEFENFNIGERLLRLNIEDFLEAQNIDTMLSYARGELDVSA